MAKYYYSDGSVLSYHDSSRVLHRLDGPAIEYFDGSKDWYIDGKKLTKKQFKKNILIMQLSGLLDG